MNNNGHGIDIKTLNDYMNTFEKLFIIDNIATYSPKIRRKYSIRVADKKLLVDPSLACIALGINSNYLLQDSKTFGFMFESLVLRDLRIYIESLEGRIYHYRDQSGLEVDTIVVLRDGRWGAIEIKLGSHQDTIIEASKNLKSFANIIDDQYNKEASFLMVVTAGKYAYVTDENILVVPITVLKN